MPAEVQMALGRIFRLMSRPFQDGDLEQYFAARAVVMAAASSIKQDYQPNYVRDCNRGS